MISQRTYTRFGLVAILGLHCSNHIGRWPTDLQNILQAIEIIVGVADEHHMRRSLPGSTASDTRIFCCGFNSNNLGFVICGDLHLGTDGNLNASIPRCYWRPIPFILELLMRVPLERRLIDENAITYLTTHRFTVSSTSGLTFSVI